MNGSQFCPNCRAETNPNAIVCVKCGVAVAAGGATNSSGKQIHPTGKTMDPVLAALLSFLIVGLGQIVLGQTIKGIVMLVVVIFTFGFGMLLIWPVAIIDAYLIAQKLRRGQSVGEWEFF
jgi:hypothetical protein